MNLRATLFVLLTLAFGGLAATNSAQEGSPEPTPQQILDRVDDLYRGKSSRAIMTMKVVSEHWTRELKLEAWSQGKEKSLFRILSPRKERGTTTLKSGDQMWNYLPKVKRIIKIPSSMMGGSWMGSHFTNDDLVKESRMSEDYDFEHCTPKDAGQLAILCLPRPEAAVVWGQVIVYVRQADWMPLEVEYFDEDLRIARTMTFADYRNESGRLLPMSTRVVPSDKPNESTEIRYQEIEFDLDLDDDLFSLRTLRQ